MVSDEVGEPSSQGLFSTGLDHTRPGLRLGLEGATSTSPRLLLAGEFDIAGLGQFRRLVRGVLATRPERLDVELSHLEVLEAMTAAALAQMIDDARLAGAEVTVTGASRAVGALLDIARERLAPPDAPDTEQRA